ncbi:MAG TPA: hypothetical protein VHF69_12425 [Candidatus Synoicihabitans sp.]|nr:hypothetical protein [Candidatus Synoicihabitans sp.]
MKLPPREIPALVVADRLVIDAAELHQATMRSTVTALWMWWDARKRPANDPTTRSRIRGWVRDEAKKIRGLRNEAVPPSRPMLTLAPWQLDRASEVEGLSNRELARRLLNQQALSRILPTGDPRRYDVSAVQDGLSREAAARFAGLHNPHLIFVEEAA